MKKIINLTTNQERIYKLLEPLKLNSSAKKRQVSAVLTDYVSTSVSGWNHNFGDDCEDSDGETIPFVIHAESHAIMNAAKLGEKYPIMFCSYSPCVECAKLIVQYGIKQLFFVDKHDFNFDVVKYGKYTVLEYLENAGIEVYQIQK